MNIKISVIIPVYNVEKFLSKTIESILNQTFKNFELILIDDGSTDKSGQICDYYENKDERVIVKHTYNKGVSSARNLGLDISKGDYISFVDSDDLIEKQMLEVLYNEIKQGDCQIVKCDFCEIGYLSKEYIENGKKYVSEYNSKVIQGNKEIFHLFLTNELGASCCDKLFKRQLFDSERFKNIIVNEDISLLLQIIPQLNNIKIIDYPFYKYVRRKNSTTTSSFSEQKIQTLEVHKDIVEFCKVNYPEYLKIAKKKYYGAVMLVLYSICYKGDKAKNNFSDKYNEIIKEVRKDIISILFNYKINIKDKIILLIMCISKKTYIKFINILNKV